MNPQQETAIAAVRDALADLSTFMSADAHHLDVQQTWTAEYRVLAYALMDRIAAAYRARVDISLEINATAR